MAYICGTSEQARGLASLITQTVSKLDGDISAMEKAVNGVKSGWDDEGNGEVDEILKSIKTALNNAKEAAPQLESSLEAYAELLESL